MKENLGRRKFLKTLGAATAGGLTFGLIDKPEDSKEGENTQKENLVKKTLGAGMIGIGAGMIANTILEQKKDGPTKKMGRMDFIKKTSKMGALLAGAGIFGSKIPNIISSINSKKDNENEEMNDGTRFPDGSVYHQKYVAGRLEKFYQKEGARMFPNENFDRNIEDTNKDTMEKLPTRNYTSSGFKNWFKENMEAGNIFRYSGEEQIKKAMRSGKLIPVNEVNEFWRCFNVKGGHKYKGRNNPSYLALHEKGLELLEKLTQIFQEKLREAGLDKSIWKIRPKIESLIRDEKLANGSDLSPHEFGLGIDFSKRRAFDLIYVPENTFMVIDEEKNNLLYKSVETLFMEALKDLDKSSKVIITSESHPPHFHIATKI
ncbi:MAG: hypothetical protein RI945_357 [Candidatus Parcubacteria bacterium]|jgi:hypothetical protein